MKLIRFWKFRKKYQKTTKILAVVHRSRETPWVMVSTMTIIAWSSGDIATIASIAVFGIFLVYAIVNSSLIWSRFKNPSYRRPFTSPIRIGRFPVLAGMGLITSIAMLFQFDINIIFGGFLVLLSIAILSIVLIKIKKWKRTKKEKRKELIWLIKSNQSTN